MMINHMVNHNTHGLKDSRKCLAKTSSSSLSSLMRTGESPSSASSLIHINNHQNHLLNNNNNSRPAKLLNGNNTSNNNNCNNGNPKKRYSCDQCSYSTDRRDLYRRHENIHRDEKPFRCYVCNKMFNRADHVKKHFLRIHKGLEYNVKLIKRINGVDYSLASSTPTTHSADSINGTPATVSSNNTNSNNNNLVTINELGPSRTTKPTPAITSASASAMKGSPLAHSQHGINLASHFNLALWKEESNRILYNNNLHNKSNYSSQSVFPQSKPNHSQHQHSHLPLPATPLSLSLPPPPSSSSPTLSSSSASPSSSSSSSSSSPLRHQQLNSFNSNHHQSTYHELLGEMVNGGGGSGGSGAGISTSNGDLLNLMNDAGLTFCLKLNGASNQLNGLNGRTHLSNLTSQNHSNSEYEKTLLLRRGLDSLTSSSPKITSQLSSSSSPRSGTPTSSSLPITHLGELTRGHLKMSLNENEMTFKRKTNSENRRAPMDSQRSSYSIVNNASNSNRKSTSLLSPITKSLPPPQTTATSLVKTKPLLKPPQRKQQPQHNSVREDQRLLLTQAQSPQLKIEPRSHPMNSRSEPERVNNLINNNHFMKSDGTDLSNKDIVSKVEEMIKQSESEFNRRLFEAMKSSSSSLLADRDSVRSHPQPISSSPPFRTKSSKKTNWFHRLNPVRVNSISILNTPPQPMDTKTTLTTTTIPSISTSNPTTTSTTCSSSTSVSMPSSKTPMVITTSRDPMNQKKFSDEESSDSGESIGAMMMMPIGDHEDHNVAYGMDDGDDDNEYFPYPSEDDDTLDDDEDDIDSYENGESKLAYKVNQQINLTNSLHQCEYCGCSFADYQSLHTHRYLLHRYINQQSTLYPYTCVLCGEKSTTQKSMINHMVNHNGLTGARKHLADQFQSVKRKREKSVESRSSSSSAVDGRRKNKRKQSEPKRSSMSIGTPKTSSSFTVDKLNSGLKLTIFQEDHEEEADEDEGGDMNNNNSKKSFQIISNSESSIPCNTNNDKTKMDGQSNENTDLPMSCDSETS